MIFLAKYTSTVDVVRLAGIKYLIYLCALVELNFKVLLTNILLNLKVILLLIFYQT